MRQGLAIAKEFGMNKNTGYFRSMVYAIMGIGWYQQYIVLNPISNEWEMISYFDKSREPVSPKIEAIQSDDFGFINYEGSSLLKLKRRCKELGIGTEHMDILRGYKDVCSNLEFMVDILLHQSVHIGKYPIERHDLSDKSEWNYILTQEDADELMELFAGFHDSRLIKANYSEEYGIPSLLMTFDNSGWYGIVDLSFSGSFVKALCLKWRNVEV